MTSNETGLFTVMSAEINLLFVDDNGVTYTVQHNFYFNLCITLLLLALTNIINERK